MADRSDRVIAAEEGSISVRWAALATTVAGSFVLAITRGIIGAIETILGASTRAVELLGSFVSEDLVGGLESTVAESLGVAIETAGSWITSTFGPAAPVVTILVIAATIWVVLTTIGDVTGSLSDVISP